MLALCALLCAHLGEMGTVSRRYHAYRGTSLGSFSEGKGSRRHIEVTIYIQATKYTSEAIRALGPNSNTKAFPAPAAHFPVHRKVRKCPVGPTRVLRYPTISRTHA